MVEVPIHEVRSHIELLLDDDEGRFPAGSSFIVDAQAKRGFRRLWLTDVSKMRLEVGFRER